MHREVTRWWRGGGEVAARSEIAQRDGRQRGGGEGPCSAEGLPQPSWSCRNANGATLYLAYASHVYTCVYPAPSAVRGCEGSEAWGS